MTPQFAVILPAAGKSSRFADKKRKKPFLDLKGRAVWLRAVEHFINREEVAQTILVVAPDDMDEFKQRFQANLAFLNLEVVEGGKERVDSVANGLKSVKPEVDFVAIHDAARPMLVKKWIDKVFEEAIQTGAAILGIPEPNTLKKCVDRKVVETASRDKIWQAQTPQVFRKDLLEKAFQLNEEKHASQTETATVATDECQLIEQLGHPISMVEGSPFNFKITTKDDFRMAKALIDALPNETPLSFMNPFSDEDPTAIF